MSSGKYCVNCIWHVKNSDGSHSCHHERFGKNLVTGVYNHKRCQDERTNPAKTAGHSDRCTQEAKYFKSKYTELKGGQS